MEETPAEQSQMSSVAIEDVSQALKLARPTQRLLAYLHKTQQRWPGKPILEKFEVIQEEAKLTDFDFGNAVEELFTHQIAVFRCAEDPRIDPTQITRMLRSNAIRRPHETRKPEVALIHFSWSNALQAVSASHSTDPETHSKDQPDNQPQLSSSDNIVSVEAIFSAEDTARYGGGKEGDSSYHLVFQNGQPLRFEDGPMLWNEPESVLREASLNDSAELSEEKSREGWIYVLKVGRNYKIGKTINLDQRMTQLRIQLPEKPEVIHTIATNNIDWVERHWHKYFATKRKNGEWFCLASEDIEELKAITRMNVEKQL